MSQDLSNQLVQAYDELDISFEQRNSLDIYLNLIKNKDEETWAHSIRVGLKSKELAEYTNTIHPKSLFYPGLLHDVGKVAVDSNSLKKKEGFDDKDMRELQKHVLDGYRILKDIHDFSARVLLYHHYFQERGYPKKIPVAEFNISRGEELNAVYCGRLLSLVDFYDAMTTRNNKKFVGKEKSVLEDKENAKNILIKANHDQKYLIEKLYEKGIF